LTEWWGGAECGDFSCGYCGVFCAPRFSQIIDHIFPGTGVCRRMVLWPKKTKHILKRPSPSDPWGLGPGPDGAVSRRGRRGRGTGGGATPWPSGRRWPRARSGTRSSGPRPRRTGRNGGIPAPGPGQAAQAGGGVEEGGRPVLPDLHRQLVGRRGADRTHGPGPGEGGRGLS